MADKLIDPAPASNLTPESFLEWYCEHREAKREQSEASALLARTGKKAKALNINKLAFKIFEDLSDLETDEAVVVLKAVVKYGSWADRPYAHQADLFHGMSVEIVKEEAKKAYDEFEVEDDGYKAGFGGQPIDNNPHDHAEPDSNAYALWRSGWTKGQEALVHKTFQGEEPKTSASPGRKGRPKRGASPEPEASDPAPTKH